MEIIISDDHAPINMKHIVEVKTVSKETSSPGKYGCCACKAVFWEGGEGIGWFPLIRKRLIVETILCSWVLIIIVSTKWISYLPPSPPMMLKGLLCYEKSPCIWLSLVWMMVCMYSCTHMGLVTIRMDRWHWCCLCSVINSGHLQHDSMKGCGCYSLNTTVCVYKVLRCLCTHRLLRAKQRRAPRT